MSDVTIREKHPRAIRWCHWLNFPLISLMVWSGILIYWANPEYIPFPQSFAKAFSLDHRLATGIGWHFALAWLFTINGIVYVLYLAISGEWRELWPSRGSLREALQVVAHDMGLRKSLPAQTGNFNAAQKFAYLSVLILALGSVVTGIAIAKPVQVGWLTEALGGYAAARVEHFVFMIAILAFFVVHIAQVVRAGWNNLRAMIAGYEVVGKAGDDV